MGEAQYMRKFEDKTEVDFVIVGAGGAGGVVAKELSTAGFQVVVLEQGPYFREKDFDHEVGNGGRFGFSRLADFLCRP